MGDGFHEEDETFPPLCIFIQCNSFTFEVALKNYAFLELYLFFFDYIGTGKIQSGKSVAEFVKNITQLRLIVSILHLICFSFNLSLRIETEVKFSMLAALSEPIDV